MPRIVTPPESPPAEMEVEITVRIEGATDLATAGQKRPMDAVEQFEVLVPMETSMQTAAALSANPAQQPTGDTEIPKDKKRRIAPTLIAPN